MNLDDIRSMGIVEARKLRLEDVLQGVFEGETYQANDYRIEDDYHNAIEQGYEVRNAYDGNLVSRHRIQWTYYEPAKEGRVKDIDVQEGNRVRRVKHDRKGKVLGSERLVVVEETVGDRIFEGAAGAAETGAELSFDTRPAGATQDASFDRLRTGVGGPRAAVAGLGAAVKRLLGRGS